MPGMDLDQHINDVVFCSIDIETTGPNPAIDRIIEIGMIAFTMERELRTFSTLIDPEVPIPTDVQAIHGITDAMVKGSPLIDTVLPDAFAFMADAILVVQNPLFDLTFMSVAGRALGLQPPPMEALDTVKLAQVTYPRFDNHKLPTLCRNLGIELEHHRAFSDASACMEVFRRIVRLHDQGERWTLGDLIDFHGDPVRPQIKRRSVMKKGIMKKLLIGREDVIRYEESGGEESLLPVVPQEFIRYGRKWYLFAFSVSENSYRYFQGERIREIRQGSTISDAARTNTREKVNPS